MSDKNHYTTWEELLEVLLRPKPASCNRMELRKGCKGIPEIYGGRHNPINGYTS